MMSPDQREGVHPEGNAVVRIDLNRLSKEPERLIISSLQQIGLAEGVVAFQATWGPAE